MVRLGHGDVIHLLVQLGVMLIMGRLFAEVARKFKQPAVVGEILAALGHGAVQGLEIIEPHIHFTPHDQSGWVACIGHQLEGQRPYRSQIDRDVLSGSPVSSGRASRKHSPFVTQFHRKPVEFRLRRIFNRADLQLALHPLIE